MPGQSLGSTPAEYLSQLRAALPIAAANSIPDYKPPTTGEKWSLTGENGSWDYDSLDELLKDNYGHDSDGDGHPASFRLGLYEGGTVYRGTECKNDPAGFLPDQDDLLEHMSERAYDSDAGEWVDDYPALEGRKTVTRRVVKAPQLPVEDATQEGRYRWSAIAQKHPRYGFCVFGETEAECAQELAELAPCPYGKRGDRLWVRETWYCDHFEVQKGPYLQPADMHDLDQSRLDGELVYAADGLAPYEQEQPTWKPSIHMPRWASRILLEITDVRVERLQDISESQATAEGVEPFTDFQPTGHWRRYRDGGMNSYVDSAVASYASLWTEINGASAWEANPWVWIAEFKRVQP